MTDQDKQIAKLQKEQSRLGFQAAGLQLAFVITGIFCVWYFEVGFIASQCAELCGC